MGDIFKFTIVMKYMPIESARGVLPMEMLKSGVFMRFFLMCLSGLSRWSNLLQGCSGKCILSKYCLEIIMFSSFTGNIILMKVVWVCHELAF